MPNLKNIIEDMVNKELDIIYQRLVDVCKCNQCRTDVVALTLNKMPPQYVTGNRGLEKAQRNVYAKYNSQIPNMLLESIEKVKGNPRPECNNKKGSSTQSNLLFSNPNVNIEFYNP